MPEPPSLQIVFDIAEPRQALNGDSQIIRCDGRAVGGWDDNLGFNVMRCPVTRSIYLRPYQRFPQWQTTFTGNYARLRKSDYTLTSPGSWEESTSLGAGDYYLKWVGTAARDEPVITDTEWPINQPFLIQWFVGGTDDAAANDVVLECGWGTPGEPDFVSLRFFLSGAVDIFKGATKVGSGTIVGNISQIYTVKDGQESAVSSLAGSLVSVTMLPHRRRELIVFSNRGGGFSHAFAHLDGDTVGTITPSGPFRWSVPDPRDAQVQLSPLRFPLLGNVLSPAQQLLIAPSEGVTYDTIEAWDAPGYGDSEVVTILVNDTDLLEYIPDGVTDTVRIKVGLNGDGTNTPALYAVDVVFDPEITTTNDAEQIDIVGVYMGAASCLKKATLSVGDSAGDVHLSIAAAGPDALEAAGLTKPLVLKNRPVLAAFAGVEFFRGATGGVNWKEGVKDKSRPITWEAQDRWKQAEKYVWTDRNIYAFDGLVVTTIVGFLIKLLGYTDDDLDIEESPVLFPATKAPSTGEWTTEPKPGDTLAQTLDTIHGDFFGSWFMGWVPTSSGWKFRLRSTESLGDVPVLKLWSNEIDAAVTLYDEGSDESEMRQLGRGRMVRSGFSETVQEPIANDVYATGYDPTTQTVYQQRRVNSTDQDPTTLPSERGDNWVGERWSAGIVDPRFRTQDDVDNAADNLEAVLFEEWRLSSIPTRFLLKEGGTVPVWRGDCIQIVGYGVYRVQSFDADFMYLGFPYSSARCNYAVRYVGPEPEEGDEEEE